MRINTNVAALNAQANNKNTNMHLTSSLEKLSSGLKINKAADDASGMAIADKLRSQANTIGQGISNANSGSALITIADKALSEQSNILDTVKTKLLQASTSTTSAEGREAIRKDIQKLLQQIDNISSQTTYNGVNLLNEKGADFSFQVGERSVDVISTTTAFAVNTNGLGSAGNEASSSSIISASTGDLEFALEGEVSNINVGAKSSNGALTFSATSSGNNTFVIAADNVSGLSTTGGTLTLTTNDKETIAFLNKEANFSTADGLTKIADGTYQLTDVAGTFSFTNSGLFDFKDLKVSGLTAAAATNFVLSTTEKVDIQKLEGTSDIDVTGASKVYMDGDSAEGISFNSQHVNVKEGTLAIEANDATTDEFIKINSTTAATQSEVGELTVTIGSEDKVKSIALANSASGVGGSVTLSTTDGNTAKALEDAGLTKNANGTFTWTATTSASNELSFGSEGIVISNLTISDMSRTTSSADNIYIETAGAVTVENNKSDTIGLDSLNFTVAVAEGNSFGATLGAADDFSASGVKSGLGSSNLNGLLSLGEGGLTAETAKNFMSVVDDAMTQLNTVRSDFGSTQNQLSASIRNLMVTEVNIKNAESVIRDVDYAKESANFNKQNIIAQAGTYALSQANAMQQNVMRLLQ